MGLLGGFKKKLINKNKKQKRPEVLCIKFETYSEFDSPPRTDIPQTSAKLQPPATIPSTSRAPALGAFKSKAGAPAPPIPNGGPALAAPYQEPERPPQASAPAAPKPDSTPPTPSPRTPREDIDIYEQLTLVEGKSGGGDSDSTASTEPLHTPLQYSSQAESIFFGDEERPIARPRNFTFRDEIDEGNDSDGSSASA